MARTGKSTSLHPLFRRKTISFIALEFIFLLSFNFLNFGNIYKLIAVAGATFMLVIYWKLWSEDKKTDLILMVASFAIFSLFYALSPVVLESQSFLYSLITLLGLPAIFIVGYVLRQQQSVSLKSILQAIVFGIALLVLISWIYTMYRYLPLYRLLYQDQVIYILGEMYRVSAEAKWLIGFQFIEVDVNYTAIYIALLLSLSPGLLFLKKPIMFKDHIWWLVPFFIGLMVAFTLPLISVFGFILPAWIVILLDRYQDKLKTLSWYKKVPTITFIILIIVVSIFILDAFNIFGMTAIITAIPPLRWVFHHPLVDRYQAVLRIALQFPLGGFVPIIVGSTLYQTTGSIIFDTLNQAGLFAFIGLILAIFFMVNALMAYARKTSHSLERTLVLSVIITLSFYFLFLYDMFPYIREESRQIPLLVVQEPLLMVLILLFGVIATDPFGLFTKRKIPNKTKLKQNQAKPSSQKEK